MTMLLPRYTHWWSLSSHILNVGYLQCQVCHPKTYLPPLKISNLYRTNETLAHSVATLTPLFTMSTTMMYTMVCSRGYALDGQAAGRQLVENGRSHVAPERERHRARNGSRSHVQHVRWRTPCRSGPRVVSPRNTPKSTPEKSRIYEHSDGKKRKRLIT